MNPSRIFILRPVATTLLTAAILLVTQEDSRRVAVLSGHGERSMADEGKEGYSSARDALARTSPSSIQSLRKGIPCLLADRGLAAHLQYFSIYSLNARRGGGRGRNVGPSSSRWKTAGCWPRSSVVKG